MTDEFVNSVTERYIELFEKITGQQFVKEEVSAADAESTIKAELTKL